jgi:large subunit ribosomal protein L6
LVGVGYRASNQGQKIRFSSWIFSQYCFQVAAEVTLETISEKGKTIVKLTSFDKQLWSQVAAKIRLFVSLSHTKERVKFVGEVLRRRKQVNQQNKIMSLSKPEEDEN